MRIRLIDIDSKIPNLALYLIVPNTMMLCGASLRGLDMSDQRRRAEDR